MIWYKADYMFNRIMSFDAEELNSTLLINGKKIMKQSKHHSFHKTYDEAYEELLRVLNKNIEKSERQLSWDQQLLEEFKLKYTKSEQ